MLNLNLQHVAGETDEVGTNAETGTAAGRHGKGGHVSVQNAKRGSSNQRNETDLVQIELALGDGVSRKCDQKTLNQIFNGAFGQLA